MANDNPCERYVDINETYSQDYGMCYTFKMQQPVMNSGRSYGLSFIFNLAVYDSLGMYTTTAALKMFLTPNGNLEESEYVDWSHEISLQPGYDHSISVHPQQIHKLSAPFSNCEYYGHGPLSAYHDRYECQFQCNQRRV